MLRASGRHVEMLKVDFSLCSISCNTQAITYWQFVRGEVARKPNVLKLTGLTLQGSLLSLVSIQRHSFGCPVTYVSRSSPKAHI